MTPKPILCVVMLALLLAFVGLDLCKTPHTAAAAEEHAVILKLKLVSGPMGNEEQLKRITELEDQLANAIKQSSSGDFDGDEYGEGFCTIYMYGPSAERLFASVQPTLKGFRAARGSYVILRYGKPGSKQDRIKLGND
jgi:hypothetical protein